MATPKKKAPVKTPVKKAAAPKAKKTSAKTSANQSQDPLSRAERAVGGAASAVGNKIKDVYQSGVDARAGVGTDLAKIKKKQSGS